MIDLHTHTLFSDGELLPSELVRRAEMTGYEALEELRRLVKLDPADGDARLLSSDQKDTVDAVLSYYGEKSSQWLSDLTHNEEPWKEARKGLLPGQRGNKQISHASMAEYYSSL
jgi:uncharacterized phage-associated protein